MSIFSELHVDIFLVRFFPENVPDGVFDKQREAKQPIRREEKLLCSKGDWTNEGRRSCLSTDACVIFTLGPHNGEVGSILASICAPMAAPLLAEALCWCSAAFREGRVSAGKETSLLVV